jgi:hypothetical protein
LGALSLRSGTCLVWGEDVSVGLPNLNLISQSISPPNHTRMLTVLVYGMYHVIRSNDEWEMVVRVGG